MIPTAGFFRAAVFAGPAVLAASLYFAAPLAAQTAETAGPETATTEMTLSDPAVERGAYIFRAGGCLACHSNTKGGGAPLAGGRPLKTPYGTFYTPNITPDPGTGIGTWSEADFVNALRHGTSPEGQPFYPAFPYTSYTGMTDQDMADLFAYLMAQPPVEQANRDHELNFPYSLRFTLGIWQALFFEAGAFQPEPGKDAAWNRGAYLVRHLGHCSECHSPRGFLGAVDDERELAGNPQGPEGGKVPNLTPAPNGLGGWSESDIAYALKTGITPDGDFLSDSMGEVVEEGTSHLSDEDLTAIAIYLKSLLAISAP